MDFQVQLEHSTNIRVDLFACGKTCDHLGATFWIQYKSFLLLPVFFVYGNTKSWFGCGWFCKGHWSSQTKTDVEFFTSLALQFSRQYSINIIFRVKSKSEIFSAQATFLSSRISSDYLLLACNSINLLLLITYTDWPLTPVCWPAPRVECLGCNVEPRSTLQVR